MSTADLELCASEWEAELEALRAIFSGEEGSLQVLGEEEEEEQDGGTTERKGQEDATPRRIRLNCEVPLEEGHALDFVVRLPQPPRPPDEGGGGKPDTHQSESGGGGDVGSAHGPSVSGIRYLPPVSLEVTIPPLYPLHEAPELQVSCLWLDGKRREQVRQALLSSFEETYKGGVGVLFSWVEWVRSGEVLSSLGIKLEVELEVGEGEGDTWQARLLRLYQHNFAKESEAFQRSTVLCLICMSEAAGSEMTALHCGHYWCCACLSAMAKLHIADGSVLSLKCPDPECGEAFTPDVVKELVDAGEFERWERLLLQKTLDKMEDLVYCPRCEAPTLEEKGHLGQCVKCYYAFCTLCRDHYHPGLDCMSPEEKMQVLQQRVDRMPPSKGPDRAAQLRRMAEESLSMQEVSRTSKRCPGCGMGITKSEGCSKVKCSSCGVYFCWLCNKDITEEGYDHFRAGEGGVSSSCVLFEAEEIARWNRTMNQHRNLQQEIGRIVRQQRNHDVRLVRCGQCRAENVVLDGNNHLHCWACRTHFCALCRAVVKKTSLHFGPGKCKQHGT